MDGPERYRHIIPDFQGFQEIGCKPLGSSVRINTLKASQSCLLQRLQEKALDFRSFPWYPLGLRLKALKPGKLVEHLLGYFHVQEEVSMVPPLVLDPLPGEVVLDLCASPGSKTTQISQQMQNCGLVVANEPSLSRISALRANCERLGAVNVAITRYDGRRFPSLLFDRALVDVPCSGEGRARRDPGIWMRSSKRRSLDLQALQVGLLSRAVELTKPGGTIVYSTCTYAPEENEMVVEKVLDRARLEKISIPGLTSSPGLLEWEGRELDWELERCARYYPHQNDTGGFFVAKLQRE
jgi:NOL1/NOP2/sun family putative RNA methylase